MIEKNEILKIAEGLSLRPDTVEKDYVLSWVLWGISSHSTTSSWAFKGGTSLKKCHFETFRFSEDLDFTLNDPAQLNSEFLQKTFLEISELLASEVGIEFFPDRFRFKVHDKGGGHYSAQGKIHYNGPLRRKQGVASIKLDLTTDEILVLSPQRLPVDHPYSDKPPDGIQATCYAFEEVVAEKVRALAQRVSPRDLYDVIHFYRNREMIDNPELVNSVLEQKCNYKHIAMPTFQSIEGHEKIDELESSWVNMLSHQLTSLPPVASFWEELPAFFDWLAGYAPTEKLDPLPLKEGESVFRLGRVASAYDIEPNVRKIQFAAANRVCVQLGYHSRVRKVEPISFRIAMNGNKLFYGFEQEAGHAKAYSLGKIESVEITNDPYRPKYPVEIAASGPIVMPMLRRK